MLFNSAAFLQFFTAFLLIYFVVRNRLEFRNRLIVAASYLFYGWWDYRFLSLLLISSLLDFYVGLNLERCRQERRRKFLLFLSIAGNLSILGFFKYFDFFALSLTEAFSRLGIAMSIETLGFILPVGISFYTFQSMSYTIDVYRREMKPTHRLVEFLAYVSFFPQLVAGPIERARRLLPQFSKSLTITTSMVEEGLWLCVWGLYKKVALADNLAPLVEMAYADGMESGPIVVLGTIAFGFQIYCDFSGYSDIARGVAKMLGFELMVNFNLPYTAVNLREFWQRWHISLSSWLRDYLYVSLGGNRRGPVRTLINLCVTMVLAGLWHGAAWNFVLWGAWHGVGLAVHRFWAKIIWRLGPDDGESGTANGNSIRSVGGRIIAWGFTMGFVFYGWLLFRAGSLSHVTDLNRALTNLSFPFWAGSYCLNLVVFVFPVVAVQIWQMRAGCLLAPLRLSRWKRALLFAVLIIGTVFSWDKTNVPFIYFQF